MIKLTDEEINDAILTELDNYKSAEDYCKAKDKGKQKNRAIADAQLRKVMEEIDKILHLWISTNSVTKTHEEHWAITLPDWERFTKEVKP